jgi:hypothetical protein
MQSIEAGRLSVTLGTASGLAVEALVEVLRRFIEFFKDDYRKVAHLFPPCRG